MLTYKVCSLPSAANWRLTSVICGPVALMAWTGAGPGWTGAINATSAVRRYFAADVTSAKCPRVPFPLVEGTAMALALSSWCNTRRVACVGVLLLSGVSVGWGKMVLKNSVMVNFKNFIFDNIIKLLK